LVPRLRKKRGSSCIAVVERESCRLHQLRPQKKSDFDVNRFLLMGRVYPRCFPLELALYGRSELASNFGFELIVSF